MMVEFIGCSGAGKTIVCKYVHDILAKTEYEVCTPLEIALGKSIADRVHSEHSQNAILDLVALPYFVFKIHKFSPFFLFCLKLIKANSRSWRQTMLLTRSVVRKLGLFIFLSQRKFEEKIVLIDEGTFHIAHVIFVNGRGVFSDNAIIRFKQMVPKPDLIVFVQAPLRAVIERTEQRTDKPIRGVDSQQLKKFLVKADRLFENLQKGSLARQDMIFVNNCGGILNSVSILANKIVDRITARYSQQQEET